MITLTILLVLGTSLYCYFRIFHSPKRRNPIGSDAIIPQGEIYEAIRNDLEEWARKTRAYPHKDYAITSFDGLTLRAKFYECKPGAPIELMFHGYRGCAERDLNGGVDRCFKLGHSALLIDHRASGYSEGRVITFGILEKRDCLSWVDFAVKEFGPDCQLILTGISMGAATVMMAAGEELPPQVKYVLADCGYTSPKEIICKVMTDMKLPAKLFYPFVKLGARLFGGFNIDESSPMEALSRSKVPVVLVHGDTDDFVPWDMSRRLYEACTSEHKKLVTVPGAGHGLAFPIGRELYVQALRDFKAECGLMD